MLVRSKASARSRFERALAEKNNYHQGRLLGVVKEFTGKRRQYLKIAKKIGTPLYLFDQKRLEANARIFLAAFKKTNLNVETYYAMKSNPYPPLLKSLVSLGYGLDVSSGRELELALSAKAQKIIFSGPGKTERELKLALKNPGKVIVNIDNFCELKRLGILAAKSEVHIKVGVRVFTDLHGGWSKFGISIFDLSKFFQEADKWPYLKLIGVQSHMSWNEKASAYQELIEIIAKSLKKLNQKQIEQIEFIDIGGGFWPQNIDGFYPWSEGIGEAMKIIDDYLGEENQFPEGYYLNQPDSYEKYASTIGSAVKKQLNPLKNFQIFLEPGRVISSCAMHILSSVIDLKGEKAIVLDGGINIAGWESYKYNYFPVINLSSPSLKERPVILYGSLCAPDDIMGYFCYAKKIFEGDVLLIPNQGAYAYTWAQNFIKPIPEVYHL
jgi:diaminopimelate decarboxylase